MRVGELAGRTGVTVRALRYYEAAGLVVPARSANGYRDYDESAVRRVEEIRVLTGLGFAVPETRPFLDCLELGHASGDECPASLVAYRDAIGSVSARIEALTRRREALTARLTAAADRAVPAAARPVDLARLPEDLPVPVDDGRAAHLPGHGMPAVTLPATDGSSVALNALGAGRTVLYVYPLSGRPGVDLPDGWDGIPGARGCTAQACTFRDHHDDLRGAGAARVYGLSSQAGDYQRELTERLRLPFTMLSDPRFAVGAALRLPTFLADGITLYRRLTMIIADGAVEHVFYPVFPPDRHATEVIDWLRAHPVPPDRTRPGIA